MIVDEQEDNVAKLEGLLHGAGYANLMSTTVPRLAGSICRDFEPDLVLLDLAMPGTDGLEVLEEIAPMEVEEAPLPVLAITNGVVRQARSKAFLGGARDSVSRPFDHAELVWRVENLLENRFVQRRLGERNRVLAEEVRERTRELQEVQAEILERLSQAAEFRDNDTGEHTRRVGRTSMLTARALGLPEERVEMVRLAAPLHDVGKIAVPDSILLKPGRLSPEEFERIKEHTTVGAKLLSGSRFPLLRLAEEVALTHHERWDGAGYPRGLRDEEIPLPGRIVAVADVYDSLVSERPYKRAWSEEDAVAELKRQKGSQFDPTVVEAFLEVSF